jgi:hypothetical protein
MKRFLFILPLVKPPIVSYFLERDRYFGCETNLCVLCFVIESLSRVSWGISSSLLITGTYL